LLVDINRNKVRIYPHYLIKKPETEEEKAKNETQKAMREWEERMYRAKHENEIS
jgi:hypothetical protein